MKYAKQIQELREYFNENNSGLERILGLSNGYLSKFEKDKIDNPNKLLGALASGGINTDWFLNGKGPIINIPILKELEEMAKESFNSPAAKYLRDYVEKNPELIRIQIEEAERALKTYNLLLNNEPQNGLSEYKSCGSEKPQNGLRHKLPGIPLVFESDKEFDDGIVIPVLDDNPVSAGHGAGIGEDELPTRFIHAPKELSKYPHLMSLPIKGDSMNPTLNDGDMVVCDGGGWDGDGVYVIKTIEETFVKRVQHTPDGYRVISDNKMYESYTSSAEKVAIVGKVRAAVVMLPGKRGGV